MPPPPKKQQLDKPCPKCGTPRIDSNWCRVCDPEGIEENHPLRVWLDAFNELRASGNIARPSYTHPE